MVAFSIFSGVTLTHAAQFETVDQGLAFVRRLLITFVLGFAIATGVSVLVIPLSSRRNVFENTLSYTQAIRSVYKAQIAYVQSAQNHPISRDTTTTNARFDGRIEHKNAELLDLPASQHDKHTDQQSRDLKAAIAALIGIHDKMANDLKLAESEVAWGILDSADLDELFTRLRSITLPLSGISMLPELHQSLLHVQLAGNDTRLVHESWKSFLEHFGHELQKCAELVMLGVQHSINVLKIASAKDTLKLSISTSASTEKSCDVEHMAHTMVPGSSRFSSRYQEEIMKLSSQREGLKGGTSDSPPAPDSDNSPEPSPTTADRGLLFKSLFLRHLMHASLQSANDLVRYADCKMAEDRLKHDRLVYPIARVSLLKSMISSGARTKSKDKRHKRSKEQPRDPEHLPADNHWEELGEFLGRFPRLLASDPSSFGFRAAAAAFSVALLAFLRQTQSFFFEQRLIWVLIVIVLGMSPTSGASIVGYISRIIATTLSFALSLAVWYIPVGHTPGVIVLLYLANMICVSLIPCR